MACRRKNTLCLSLDFGANDGTLLPRLTRLETSPSPQKRWCLSSLFSSARTDSKTQQNIERMTFALTWCANIFVECSVTPNFFSADYFVF